MLRYHKQSPISLFTPFFCRCDKSVHCPDSQTLSRHFDGAFKKVSWKWNEQAEEISAIPNTYTQPSSHTFRPMAFKLSNLCNLCQLYSELVVRSSSIVLPTLIKSTAPTPCKVIHFSRIMRTVHTHFGVPLGSAPGRWKDKKRLCCLPLYLNLEISSNLSCALISCHHLSCVTPDWP